MFGFCETRGMFEYYNTSKTVSYAEELTSISTSICYSQGNGFNTILSRLLYLCTQQVDV